MIEYSVSISQDTKSIMDLLSWVGSLTEEKKAGLLKLLVGQMLYLDLTQPDLTYMISALSRSSSKTQSMKDSWWLIPIKTLFLGLDLL